MSGMKRRAFLAGAGFALGVPTGLAWNGWREMQSCSGSPRWIETTYALGGVLTDAAREELGSLASEALYQRAITSHEALSGVVAEDGDAWSFAAGTDFEREFLVLVAVAGSSTPRLALECVEWTDDGLDLRVAVTSESDVWTNDLVEHALLVRVAEPGGDVPLTASVDVEWREPEPLVDRLF